MVRREASLTGLIITLKRDITEKKSQHKKWYPPLWISSVNVTKSAGNWEFGHIYWIYP